MRLLILASLSLLWPHHKPYQPQAVQWYVASELPRMPEPYDGYYWSCYPDGLVYRLFPQPIR